MCPTRRATWAVCWRRSCPGWASRFRCSPSPASYGGRRRPVPGKGGGTHNLRVLTHNVDAANTDHAGTAREVLAADADVVALEEMTPSALRTYEKAFAARYPYHVKRSTVGLWSRYPIAESGSVDIGLSWTRALRAQVATPEGDVAFYVAHLASVRIGSSGFTAN